MITCRSAQEIAKIRASAQLTAATLQHIAPLIQPGMTTAELDRVAETYIRRHGGLPAFKGYRGFPATLCTSINAEVVHGIPSKKRKLVEGDIIGIDCGAIVDGYYGDHAITFAVGSILEEAQHLIDTTSEALAAGIAQAKIGNYLSDISHAIQVFAEQRGYAVVKVFVGQYRDCFTRRTASAEFWSSRRGPRLRAGMVLALEPMINVGTVDVQILQDNWTVVTADGRLSAHFEHTITVAEHGVSSSSQP
jgi:methionyl aminopeptidase